MHMRLSNVILVLSLGGVGAAGALVGCGSDTATGTTTTTTGAGGSGSTGSNTTSGGTDPCSPPVSASCPQVASSACIALVDNSAAKQFTLRMADLTLTAPPSLIASTAIKGIIQNAVTMKLDGCNLSGGGTFSWLLQFDTATGKLTTGGAKPADDPTKGYSFVNEMITQNGTAFKIAPITADAAIKNGDFAIAMGQDVIVPIYLDAAAAGVVLLPLHAAKLSGKVSADNNCIGKYNSAGLDPAGGCVADDTHPAFIGTSDGKANSDGSLDGYITLEEADNVIIDVLKQSLCVVLSGDGTTYGDQGTPIEKCKRDAGNKIVLQGDWCSTTNDASCKDAMRLTANFSASAVKAN
jgi:hypothetical protein